MNEISFIEKFPHVRLCVTSVTKSEVTEEDIPQNITVPFYRKKFPEKYYMMSINDGALKALMHKGISGTIEPTYMYDIWYEFGTDMSIEILMALRTNL